MKRFSLSDFGIFLLRLGVSVSFMSHGYGKFMRLIQGNLHFADPIGIGETPSLILTAFAEFVCPIAIIIGWKTRLAAIPPAITMIVAAFIVHPDDGWGKIELPLLYLICFLFIALNGPGRYAIDRR